MLIGVDPIPLVERDHVELAVRDVELVVPKQSRQLVVGVEKSYPLALSFADAEVAGRVGSLPLVEAEIAKTGIGDLPYEPLGVVVRRVVDD